MEAEASAPQPRSDFVTVVGWVFLAVGAMKSALCLVRLSMLSMAAALGSAAPPAPRPDLPFWLRIGVEHDGAFAAAACAIAALTVAAGAGLLLRRGWARRLLVALLALGILRCALGLAAQATAMARMPPPPLETVALRLTLAGLGVASLLVSLLFAALNAWLIYRLSAPDAKAEFE